MKNFLVPFLVCSLSMLFISCESTEDGWNKLSQQEKDEVLQQAQQKCTATHTPIYAAYKNSSNNVFTSNNYTRGKGFYLEYKSGNDIKRKVDFRVWKQDRNTREIYFYVTETILGPSSYFLRITENDNDLMISKLLTDQCAKKFTANVDSDGPLNIDFRYDVPNAPNTDQHKDTYSLPFAELAYFATLRLQRTVTTKDSAGATVGSSVSYTGTPTNKDYTFGSTNYEATSGSNRLFQPTFCTVSSTANYAISSRADVFAYERTCDSPANGVQPAGWNL